MVLKMARNGDDLAAHVQFPEQPAHQAIIEVPLEPTLQENEILLEKGDRGSGKLGPKLMVEKVAGSGVYYRAFVKSTKADRVLLYFPPDREAQRWEWVYKCSSRIHRGTVSGRCSWKYQGEGAWKVQVKPNKKKGASRPKQCKKQRSHLQPDGCHAAAQQVDSTTCNRHAMTAKAPSKESENATGSCSSLQADISTGVRVGSRHEDNPIASWFQRHSVLCSQQEQRMRGSDVAQNCKLGQFSPAAESLCTPAPFVEYLNMAVVPLSNVLSSSGSMEHCMVDAARLSSFGGAERRDNTGADVVKAGRCPLQDGDDGSHSTESLHNCHSGVHHVSHSVGISPQHDGPLSPASPEIKPPNADAEAADFSPCQDRKGVDLPETSSLANDSSDTATMYGNDAGSCAFDVRKTCGQPSSQDARRQLCS